MLLRNCFMCFVLRLLFLFFMVLSRLLIIVFIFVFWVLVYNVMILWYLILMFWLWFLRVCIILWVILWCFLIVWICVLRIEVGGSMFLMFVLLVDDFLVVFSMVESLVFYDDEGLGWDVCDCLCMRWICLFFFVWERLVIFCWVSDCFLRFVVRCFSLWWVFLSCDDVVWRLVWIVLMDVCFDFIFCWNEVLVFCNNCVIVVMISIRIVCDCWVVFIGNDIIIIFVILNCRCYSVFCCNVC